jgi:predicted nucleotidyltransferase
MKTKSIKEKIQEYFYQNPQSKLRVREIERTLSLPLPSVIRYCKELMEEEILQKVDIGSIVLYTASDSEHFRLRKKLYNIETLYTSKLVEHLKMAHSNPVIILFGSYSRGEDTNNSDIDLYIQTPTKKKIDVHIFEKKLHRPIQVFQYTHITNIENKHLANNILNGIVLNNQIEVFK